MKRGIIIVLAALLPALVSGCKAEADAKLYYAYPLATASPEDTVTQIYAEKFAEEVDRLSDGKIKIQVYANSVLGGDRELLESCYDGDIPFVIQNTAPQVNFIPDTAVFDAPCVYYDLEAVRETIDDPVFMKLLQTSYRDAGYELLGYSDQGFRVMSTNKVIDSFTDFRGLKIRTMENSYHLDFWKALNANPTPMSFSEVYIGLQQNTINAQENPYEVIVSNRLYEQQAYVVETNHLPHLISMIVSKDFYDSLTREQQEILQEAQDAASAYSRDASDQRISDRIRIIEESGTRIIELNEEVRAEMTRACEPVYKKIRTVVAEDIADAYMDY